MKKSSNKPKVVYGFGVGEQDYINEQTRESSLIQIIPKKEDRGQQGLAKSIVNVLNSQSDVSRLAFEVEPSAINNFAGIYKPKLRGVPDIVLKRIAVQDSLVSNIVRTRQNHVSMFGSPRQDRHSFGFILKPHTGLLDTMDTEARKEFSSRISRAVSLFATCGHTHNVPGEHQKTFSEYLALSTRSAIVPGRIATEIIYETDMLSNNRKFHHFAAVDAATVFPATTDFTGQEAIRDQAYDTLSRLMGTKLVEEPDDYKKYTWVQVVEGTPKQVFTSDELKCYNFYPVPDVEWGGFPVTPIDTVITAITTHINITTHNKMYFQSGRATRGMLVLTSDDVNPTMLSQIKQNFNASINGVSSSWRMPCFGISTDSKIEWQPLDPGGGRDMEFQYLTDMNAREILTAFMMSPDELPGWNYLSKGTASQSLSEKNNEYQLQSARDVGIRPLLKSFEQFINAELFPLIDEELSKQCTFVFMGLDAESQEQENKNIADGQPLWMSFNDILQKVEKPTLPKDLAGDFPLNPVYYNLLKELLPQGEIIERFLGVKGASKDPNLQYFSSQFWFSYQNLLIQKEQLKQAAQQAAQQPQGPPDGGGGNPTPSPDRHDEGYIANNGEMGNQNSKHEAQAHDQADAVLNDAQSSTADMEKAVLDAFNEMQKSELNLPPQKRRVSIQHQKLVTNCLNGFKKDSLEAIKEILDTSKKLRKAK